MQRDVGDLDPALAERGEDAAAERPARARHLRAPRLEREDRLEVGERPWLGEVAVADRLAVLIEVGEQRPGEREPRGPQPLPAKVRRQQLRLAAAGERELLAGATSTPRATSEVTSDVVNGRPALGISALPGWRAKTVW